MSDTRQSPAVTAILAGQSPTGAMRLGWLLRSLTRRPEWAATKVLGALSVTVDWLHEWLEASAVADIELRADAVVAAAGQLARRAGTPANTGGILLGLLAGDDAVFGGVPGTMAEVFALYPDDIAEVALGLRDDAVAELACLLSRPQLTPTPLPPLPPLVVLPYSALLEEALDRARQVVANRGERQVSSDALLAATNSLFLTADLRRFYQALGYSPVLMGAHSAAVASEPAGVAVLLAGPDPAPSYRVSEPAAVVLWAAAILGGVDCEMVIRPELLFLAQVSLPSCRLGALVAARLPPGVIAAQLFARWADPAGISPEQLQVATTICLAGAAPTGEPFADSTGDLLAAAAGRQLLRSPPSSGQGLSAGLRAATSFLHPQLGAAAIRLCELVDGAAGAAGEWDAHLEGVSSALDGWGADIGAAPAELSAAVRACLVPPARAPSCRPIEAAVAAAGDARRHPTAENARRLYRSKLALQQRQGDGPAGHRWASAVAASWPEVAARLADQRLWREAAIAAVTAARVAARASLPPVATPSRWAPRLPPVELAGFDIAGHHGQLLVVCGDDQRAVALHRNGSRRWRGTVVDNVGERLGDWWRRWEQQVRSDQPLTALLHELPPLLGVTANRLAPGRVELIVAGLPAAVPLAQALIAISAATLTPVVHVLGGLEPPTVFEAPRRGRGDICLVEEPAGAGRSLRFASVETTTLRHWLQPQTVLTGTHASRAWLQRVLTASTRAQPPDVVHYVGHGTFEMLANGDLAASLRLADGQRFTPNDLLRVHSQVGTVICSACDIGVLGGALGAASPPWPLAAVRTGVSNVVASAWPVDDAASVLLMTRFHQQWRHRDLSAALAAAAKWLHARDRDELDAHLASLEGPDAAALTAEITQRSARGGDLDDAGTWASFAVYCA